MKTAKYFSSWSGGKDSCLALYRALKSGLDVTLLFTSFIGSGDYSRAHGLKEEIIKAQARSIGIESEIGFADFGKYGGVLTEFIERVKPLGICGGVFGDIDLVEHKEWIEDITKKTDICPVLPLWNENRELLVREFIDLGFETIIVAVKTSVMDKSFLGKVLDHKLVDELIQKNIDPAGEGGEFHTLVVDGPIFNERIELDFIEIVERGKNHFLEVALKNNL